MYIVIAILAFGFLIAIHEFGHFFTAKLMGVTVNEFAIGMGPAILKKKGKHTVYSLRLLPLGGFCAMEGEDGNSDDPGSFNSKAPWKRFTILIAGAGMNFIAGFLAVVIIFSSSPAFATNEIEGFESGCPYSGADGLQAGDKVLSIDGEPIYYSNNFSTYAARSKTGYVDIVVLRSGKKVELKDFKLVPVEYEIDGETVIKYGINFRVEEANLLSELKYSWHTTCDFVRMVRVGIVDLITGNASVKDMSGVVGIVSTINDVGNQSASPSAAAKNIAYLCAFIAVNLAVMNLLPIPALDGGRVFFLIITTIIEKVFRKKVNAKYEGYINAAGLILLVGLMIFVMYNDITRLIFN